MVSILGCVKDKLGTPTKHETMLTYDGTIAFPAVWDSASIQSYHCPEYVIPHADGVFDNYFLRRHMTPKWRRTDVDRRHLDGMCPLFVFIVS